jgi:hypothetical protein
LWRESALGRGARGQIEGFMNYVGHDIEKVDPANMQRRWDEMTGAE